MNKSYLLKHLKKLKFTRNYFYLSLVYGFSTLLIPFGVQMLVNNLALAGIWVNTLSFLIIIGIGFFISIFMKYVQFVLIEFMQRHILGGELEDWYRETTQKSYQTPYFFEMFKILKSFSLICGEGMDFVLTFGFGVLALAFISPSFLVISLLFCLSLVIVRLLGSGAVISSIEESNRKYDLYFGMGEKDYGAYTTAARGYLTERHRHFGYIRRQAIMIYSTCVFLQLLLLAWGIHLIQIQELSIGQLVSAEIIVSNLLMNFIKLPKLLDVFYDFETACYKLDYGKVVKS